MKSIKDKRVSVIAASLIIAICFSTMVNATTYVPVVPNYNQGAYNPYYNNYPSNGYYPNYNPYNNYYPNYNSGNAQYIIPSNSYYYISGYDRPVTSTSNGEPMVSRVPILAGNYSYPTYIANGLVYGAYRSISTWCNNNILTGRVKDYFLNFASIVSETPYEIVMNVNCALYQSNAISGFIEFKIVLDIASNRYKWTKLGNDNDRRLYEYDSLTGTLREIS